MRTLFIVLLVITLLAGGAAVYLAATTPSSAAGVRFPLTSAHRQLIASVPPNAEVFALVPAAAAVQAKVVSNPVTREALAGWNADNPLPPRWILGGGDLVVWKSGATTRYALALDPFRAALFRVYLLVSGTEAVINPSGASGSASLDLELANGLPPGDAFVVQRDLERGAYPPIGRPAFSSVQIGADDVVVTSRAAASTAQAAAPGRARFARSALLTASFAKAPRIASDLNRLFGSRISAALEQGGSITIYEIDTGTLLPSPKGVIALPPTAEAREAAQKLSVVAQVRETPEAVLISFDEKSLDRYAADQFTEGQWPSTEWAVQIDAQRMIPILERLSDKTGLRLVTPRIYRSVRDLRGWIGDLAGAHTVEAAHNRTAAADELRVRISSK